VKIIFLTHNKLLPSPRYRVMQFLPYLRSRGFECTVEEMPSGILAKRRLFRRLDRFDIVFVQKKTFYPWDIRAIRRRARTLVYDLDDAVMFSDSLKGGAESWQRRWRFGAMVRAADLVIAGNDYLADQVRRLKGNVRIIPTCVDLRRYTRRDRSRRNDGRVVLGWIGTWAALDYVRPLRPVIERLGRLHGNIALKIICNRFFDLDGVPVMKIPWSRETEVEELFDIDIGLAPAVDDNWWRGKCGLKIIQYFAAGKPVVCNPVGVNAQLVADGGTGFQAASREDWFRRLERLIEDEALRRRMGAEGRKLVEERYSLDVNAPLCVEALESAAGGRQNA